MAPIPDEHQSPSVNVRPDVDILKEEEGEDHTKATEAQPCLGKDSAAEVCKKKKKKEKDAAKEEDEFPMLEMLARNIRTSAKADLEESCENTCPPNQVSYSDHQTGCCYSPYLGPYIRQVTMAIVACLAGVSVGMIHAYPAVALPRWEEMGTPLPTVQATWFASTPMVVSMLACVGSGVLVESQGTRRILFISLPFLALSWIMIGVLQHFWVLLVARIIQGVVAALYMVVITVYPAEVSVPRWRGMTMCVSEAMVMLGVFLTYLAGLVLQPSPLAYMIAASLVPQAVCFYFLREAPLWLARQDRDEETAASLACLRGPQVDITMELEQIKSSVFTERIQKPTASEQLLLLKKQTYLKPLILSVLVLLFKELTGQYAAMAYTVQIFKMAGSSLDPYLCTVVMGAARFLPCFVSWLLIERLPRRLLLSSCMTLASFALATLGAFLWFWSLKEEPLPESLGWIPLACLLVFTLAFGSGVGTTSWTLVAELLPSQVRNVGAGIINTSFSLFLFLVGLTFPFMVELMTIGGVFIVYSGCSLMGALFVVTCLPETRGRTFAEIQRSLDSQASNAI
ncbi:facilitated trehalose transporter Tret1-2 homolog isoform X2 [Penaeus japonicus]|nr:facilitated trehalose transporter Tret1-2 homolog isoform X2 [Penaeus japonicus]